MNYQEPSSNVKTLIFSDMTVDDQERIMELMINNNVEFQQARDGNYVATIKLVHQASNQHMQQETKGREVEQHQQNQQYYPQQQSQLYNQSKSGKKSKSPNRKKSPTQQRYYEQFGDGRYQNKMRELEDYDRNVANRQAKLVSNIQNMKKQINTKKAAKKRELDSDNFNFSAVREYDKINKPYIPKKKPIVENQEEFSNFCQFLKLPPGLRPKRMNLANLLKMVQEIYTACFQKNSSSFKQSLNPEIDPQIPKTKFPKFVAEHLQSKYKHKKIFQQNAADFLASIDHHRHQAHQIQTFALFLSESYDASDLIFFLYVRFLTQRELNTTFSSPQFSKKVDSDIRQFLIPSKTAFKIGKIFFDQDESLLSSFMANLQEHFITPPQSNNSSKAQIMSSSSASISKDSMQHQSQKFYVQVTTFLGLILEQFHQQKKNGNPQSIDINEEISGFQGTFPGEELQLDDQNLAQHVLRVDDKQHYAIPSGQIIQQQQQDTNSSRMGASSPHQPRQTPPYGHRATNNNRRVSGLSSTSQGGNSGISQQMLLIKQTLLRHIQKNKVKGSIDKILQPYQNLKKESLQAIGDNLIKMLSQKVDELLDALFRNDKIKWLDCLMILDDPTNEQLNYIQNMQMLVKQLYNSAKESVPFSDIDHLATLVLETPQLKYELGKLVSKMVQGLEDKSY